MVFNASEWSGQAGTVKVGTKSHKKTFKVPEVGESFPRAKSTSGKSVSKVPWYADGVVAEIEAESEVETSTADNDDDGVMQHMNIYVI